MSNSVDLDDTAKYEPSHLVLHIAKMYVLYAGLKGGKHYILYVYKRKENEKNKEEKNDKKKKTGKKEIIIKKK